MPRIRKPTVKSKTTSRVPVSIAVINRPVLCLLDAAHPAAAAHRKLSTELSMPIPRKPIPDKLAASVANTSRTKALVSQAVIELINTAPSGNFIFSPENKKTPPDK